MKLELQDPTFPDEKVSVMCINYWLGLHHIPLSNTLSALSYTQYTLFIIPEM